MTDYAVRAMDVSKRFLIHSEKRSSIKERFVRGRAPKAREFWALKHASFDIPKGQTFGIIGHNGSGKSTALKVLTGVYRPTSGSVEVNGRVSALLELGAGFHPELTGRENIRLHGSILGFSPKQIESIMDDIIDFSGVEDFIDTPVKVYSSGMYVRLGFAIAVKVDPEVLLVDEVIAVGDEQFQRKCFDYLYELRRKGASIVLVSHGMGQVEDLCDQVVWLDHGEVVQIGPAREVVRSYIHRINEAEAATGGHEHVNGTVSGSQEVVIHRVSGSSGSGDEEAVLRTGQPAEFGISFECLAPIDTLQFRLEWLTESGLVVAVEEVQWGAGELHSIGSGHELRYRVDAVPLLEGSYMLNASAVSRGHVLFRQEDALRIKVLGDQASPGGVVSLRGRWDNQPMA